MARLYYTRLGPIIIRVLALSWLMHTIYMHIFRILDWSFWSKTLANFWPNGNGYQQFNRCFGLSFRVISRRYSWIFFNQNIYWVWGRCSRLVSDFRTCIAYLYLHRPYILKLSYHFKFKMHKLTFIEAISTGSLLVSFINEKILNH